MEVHTTWVRVVVVMAFVSGKIDLWQSRTGPKPLSPAGSGEPASHEVKRWFWLGTSLVA